MAAHTTPSKPPGHNDAPSNTPGASSRPGQARSLFAVPTPIKQLFDRFPLLTYPALDLPLRAPPLGSRNTHVLHIFAEEGATEGSLSFNPACLKWQAYLKFCGVTFRVQRSCNHASPSGALPFLLPARDAEGLGRKGASEAGKPVPSGRLQRWCREVRQKEKAGGGSVVEEPGDLRYEAYLSLVDLRIRRAWLYTVYLSPNAPSLAEPLYILPASKNPFVRLSIARDLRAAAEAELVKYSTVINADELYKGAEEAFAALEMLLGDHEWFFGAEAPGLFDASVFAYTQLLLDDDLGNGWVDGRLRDAVKGRRNLVGHRERVLRGYFGGGR